MGKLPEPAFVAQFGSAEDVERRIANRANEDANLPEWNWCGICCVRMVLLGLGMDPPPLGEMYRTAFDAYGVFKNVDGSVVGAYHREFAEYVRSEFDLPAEARRGLSANDVAAAVADSYVIASVSPNIREIDGLSPVTKSGHLVLVYRVEETERGRVFVLNNSAGFNSTNSQVGVRVPEARFLECFSGSAVLISRP